MCLRYKEWGPCYAAELTHDGWDAYGGVEKLISSARATTTPSQAASTGEALATAVHPEPTVAPVSACRVGLAG